MKLLITLFFLLVLLTARTLQAEPIDLSTACRMAEEYDAKLRTAKADKLIYKEEVDKARSQFRPNVRVNASRGRNSTQYGRKYFIPSLNDYRILFNEPDYYNTVNYGLTIRQPILNLSNNASYKQAELVTEKSYSDFHKEELSLWVRVVEAYCNTMYAEDNLEFSQALIKATEEQFQQAKRRYEKGFGTVTEVEEAQAGLDNARAEGVDIQNSVTFSRRELENIIGVYPSELYRVVPQKLFLVPPDSTGLLAYISGEINPSIVSARHEIAIAKKEVDKQRASRYPTLDLTASRNYSESENNYSIGSIYNTYSIALQMSMPIYSGGYISSSVRQAKAKQLRAVEALSAQKRGVESDIRRYYNGVVAAIAQIKAYEQAVRSQDIALTGTKKGYQVGIRNNVDVLDAQQKLYAAKRNLAKSRYQYILNSLMVKQATGTLSISDIDEVNGWLSAK